GDGRSRGSPLRRAVGDPAGDQADLVLGEPAEVGELAVARNRLPRRHVAGLDRLANVVAPRVRVLVVGERERRELAGAVAGLAVALEDPDDLLVEGHGPIADGLWPKRGVGARLAGGDEQRDHEGGASHDRRTTRPGRAPVWSPPSTTTSPFTTTVETPTA